LDEHLGERVKEQFDWFIDLSPEGEVTAAVHKYGYRATEA
jgi:hypothetical protein